MAQKIDIGDYVKWKWATGLGHGLVKERFTEHITRTISGSKIVRNATTNEPAYLIEQEGGGQVLKSRSEIELAK
jgi:hypothetical protein